MSSDPHPVRAATVSGRFIAVGKEKSDWLVMAKPQDLKRHSLYRSSSSIQEVWHSLATICLQEAQGEEEVATAKEKVIRHQASPNEIRDQDHCELADPVRIQL